MKTDCDKVWKSEEANDEEEEQMKISKQSRGQKETGYGEGWWEQTAMEVIADDRVRQRELMKKAGRSYRLTDMEPLTTDH